MFFPAYSHNSFFTNIVNIIQIKTEKELYVKINNNFLIFISLFLKLNNFLQYKILNDLIIIDYPNRKKRYQIIYYFLSIMNNTKFFLFIDIEETKVVPSLTTIYNSSN
jgi:NADH-quinone oxidoreductase subunit C